MYTKIILLFSVSVSLSVSVEIDDFRISPKR